MVLTSWILTFCFMAVNGHNSVKRSVREDFYQVVGDEKIKLSNEKTTTPQYYEADYDTHYHPAVNSKRKF